MRRKESDFASPAATASAGHLGSLVKQARLARSWTQRELAERARVSLATLKRIESGRVESSLGAWLALFEMLGLLPLVDSLHDPVSAALMDQTRSQRIRPSERLDLDF